MGRAKQRADRIREKIDIAEVLADYGYFVHAEYGGEEQFRCDLHGDGQDNKPSARVYPESNSWYCFACGRSRDAVETVREKEGLGFWDAVKLLESKYNLPYLPWDDSYADDDYERKEDVAPADEQLADILDSGKSYEDEKKTTYRFLEMFTEDRELDMKSILGLWEAYDMVTHLVYEEVKPESWGKTEMLKIRAKGKEKMRNLLKVSE